jgi:hypothetical protein
VLLRLLLSLVAGPFARACGDGLVLHAGFLRRDMGPATKGHSPLVCIENSIQVRASGSKEMGKIEKQQLTQAQHVSTL